MLSLHSLEPSRSTKDAKRRGRGNASGRGTYSTRGIKGQRARSGGRGGLVLKGVRGYILRIPKSRGFKSLAPEVVAISLRQLDGAFQDGEVVTLKKIQQAGFTPKGAMTRIKIIGGGLLKKKLNVKAHGFTPSAQEAIIKAGGKAEVLPLPVPPVKVKHGAAAEAAEAEAPIA
jgi:large subunit ribosomal protein L15